MESLGDQHIRQQIDAYIKGKLKQDEIEALWQQIAKDPSLLEDLELEIGVRELLKKESKSKKSSTYSLPNWTWHVSAAAVILLVALVQLFKVETPTELNQFVIGSIKADQIESSEGIRAKDMVITIPDSLLNLGFKAVLSGNNNQALDLFDEIITNYDVEPYGSKAFLNKGILYYNNGEYEEAISAFLNSLERASDNRMISEKAYWFLGNAYVNTEQLEKALEAVGIAYSKDGVFRSAAFKLYQKLSYDLGKVDFEDFDSQKNN